MRLMDWLLGILIFLISTSSKAQIISYTKGYYRYPLAIPPKLNANFGEMRSNHFHMGLDLSTQKRENLPIYAAADGYVSRLKIEPGGFGRAIYLDHPNGTTTLYAHMNDFMPELERYLKQRQYEKESWMMDLPLPVDAFPIRKGQFIGYSGNTGGSQGPHVHFEIRETSSDKCLNPLLFGFDIADNVPPDLKKLAVYDRNRSTYEQTPTIHPLSKKGAFYLPAGVIRVNTDRVVISLQATDRMSGFDNPNGIFRVKLFEGDRLLGGFSLDRIGYDETRYLNAHIDYRFKLSGGSYFQYIFPLPGDMLDIYHNDPKVASILLMDSAVRHFRLEVYDPYGNRSEARFSMQKTGAPSLVREQDGILMRAGEIGVYETDQLQVVLPEKGLYDSVHLTHISRTDISPKAFSPMHDVHRYTTPVHQYFTIRLKADKPVPYTLRDRMLIRKISNNDILVRKASWELGWYAATFREFGGFQLVGDDTPPQISFNGLIDGGTATTMKSIVVTTQDDNKTVKNFRAELDGKWLMFSQKGSTFTYRFDDHCPPGKHTLTVSIEDEAGNKTTRNVVFYR
jgi:hypothetical protein